MQSLKQILILAFVFFTANSIRRCQRRIDRIQDVEALKAVLQIQQTQAQFPLFDRSVSKMCPSMPSKYIKTDEGELTTQLGNGKYGSVFQIASADGPRAVKLIDIRQLIISDLMNNLPSRSREERNCRKSLLTVMEDSIVVQQLSSLFSDDIEISDGGFRSIWPEFKLKIFSTEECQKLPEFVEIALLVLNENLESLRVEIEINQSLHSSLPSSIFYAYHGCMIEKNLQVYMFMEVMGENWASLRSSCPKNWGGRSFAERLLTYIRLLWQVGQLHELGYIHCDLKLHNVLSKKDNYLEFSIGDYGLASNTVCTGGTVDWEPPELDYMAPNLDSTTDLFGVKSSFKQDSFAIGMLILMAELKREDAIIVRQAYRMLKERANGNSASFGEEEKKFINKTQKVLEKAWDSNSIDPIQVSVKSLFKLRFVQTVMGLLSFDHKKRIPVRVALIQMHVLYQATIDLRMHVLDMDDYWVRKDLLKQEMKNKETLAKIKQLLMEQFNAEKTTGKLVI